MGWSVLFAPVLAVAHFFFLWIEVKNLFLFFFVFSMFFVFARWLLSIVACTYVQYEERTTENPAVFPPFPACDKQPTKKNTIPKGGPCTRYVQGINTLSACSRNV